MAKSTQTSEDKRRAYMKDYRKEYGNRRVGITLTPSEYAAFETIAQKEGLGVATVLKNMAVAYQQTNTLFSAEIAEQLSELNFLARNVANNINQIAHKANLGETVDVNEVLAYIKQLDSIVKDHTKNKLKRK